MNAGLAMFAIASPISPQPGQCLVTSRVSLGWKTASPNWSVGLMAGRQFDRIADSALCCLVSLGPNIMTAQIAAKPQAPVLITGGAGFIGTNLAERLLRLARRVRICDNSSLVGAVQNLQYWLCGYTRYGSRFEFHNADIRNVCPPGDLRRSRRGRDRLSSRGAGRSDNQSCRSMPRISRSMPSAP